MQTAQYDRVQKRFERHVLSVRLEVRRKPPHPPGPLPGLTMEISAGGFSAMVSNELKLGESITANLELPGRGRIAVEAIVRNKNLFRYGFEFIGLSAQAQQAIQQGCGSLPVYEGSWL